MVLICCELTALVLQIDEDVQRHNDLLDVISREPSEISNIVSKRRKDFTNEFFEHLHAVTESYYDNAEKQTGGVYFCNFLVTWVGLSNNFFGFSVQYHTELHQLVSG